MNPEGNQRWDRQIEEDATNGRLQGLYQRLESENRDEPEIPLADFLDNLGEQKGN